MNDSKIEHVRCEAVDVCMEGSCPTMLMLMGGPDLLVIHHLGKLRCWNVAPGSHPPLFDDGGFRDREEKGGSFEFGTDNNPLPPFFHEEEQSTRQGDLGRCDVQGGEKGYQDCERLKMMG